MYMYVSIEFEQKVKQLKYHGKYEGHSVIFVPDGFLRIDV